MDSLTIPLQSRSIRTTDKVYVADPINRRIQSLTQTGSF